MLLLSAIALNWLTIVRANVAQYVTYANYSVNYTETTTDIFTPTVYDCLAQSTALPQTNGVAYQNSTNLCRVLNNNNNAILISLHANPGWIAYVKDISSQFVTVFISYAAQSNVAIPIAQIYTTGTGGSVTTNYSAALSNSSAKNYWNTFISYWNVTQVSVCYSYLFKYIFILNNFI